MIRSDHNGQVTEYGYDVFGRRLYKKNQNAQTLTLFGWDGDLMIWEGFVAQRFEIQSPLIEPNLRRNLGKWST